MSPGTRRSGACASGALKDATDQPSKDRVAAIDRWLQLSSQGAWSSFVDAYDGHQAEVDDSLLNGRSLFASTRAEDNCAKLVDSINQHMYRMGAYKVDSVLGVLHLIDATATLEGHYILLGESPGMTFGAHLRLQDDDTSYPLNRRLAGWEGMSDVQLAQTALRPAPLGNTWLITLADQLAVLHRRTEAPIVADAYRVPCSVGHQTGDTIGEFATRPPSAFSKLR